MNRHVFIGPRTPAEQWRHSLKHWIIQSPMYEYTERLLDDGSGPQYETCDMVDVDAINKRDALICGIKIMRKQMPFGYLNGLSSWENPFKGMLVMEYSEDGEFKEIVEEVRELENQSLIEQLTDESI